MNPPTETDCGEAPAPNQFGLAEVPVPGQEWQELQSWVPEVAVKAPWLKAVNVAPGFTFMWQLLHLPVVPFITSGLAEVKFTWNFASAHSLPWMPATVETPAWVWQDLQSRPETLTSVCVSWS